MALEHRDHHAGRRAAVLRPGSLPLRILAMAPNAWRGPWMNRQQLLSRLGRRHRIMYSNGLRFRWDRDDDGQVPTGQGGFEHLDNVIVDEAPARLSRWPRVRIWDRFVCRRGIARLLHNLDGEGPLVAYLFHPQFAEYLPYIGADRVVYHAYDQFSLTPGWSARLARSERRLLRKADLVLASSERIARALSARRDGGSIEVLPNGADTAAFITAAESAELPSALAGIPRPRIGYAGNLNRKVDFALIAALAERQPQWQFVVVGGRQSFDATSEVALAHCEALGNVHFLGSQDVNDVPRYVAAMDANMICSRVDADLWSVATYPLKLHEYLAAGRPVVACDLHALRPFSSVLRIAAGVDDWEAALTSAIADGGVGTCASRRAVAVGNDWDLRVEDLDAALRALF